MRLNRVKVPAIILGSALGASLVILELTRPSPVKGIAFSTASIAVSALVLFLFAGFLSERPARSLRPALWAATLLNLVAFAIYGFGSMSLVNVVYFMARFLGPYGIQPFGLVCGVVYGAINILGWALLFWPLAALVQRFREHHAAPPAAA